MQVAILTTDGGPHPADKWAAATTKQIMDAVFSEGAQQGAAARKFEIALLDILEPHHAKVQIHQRDEIANRGIDAISDPIDPREHTAAVVVDIVAAAKQAGSVDGKDLGEHFTKADVQEKLAGLVGAHFATSMDIERSWHADRNANHPEAKAYRMARTEHGAAHVHAHIHKYRTAG